MKIIEYFLDQIQLEKLDVKDIVRKSNKMFLKIYQVSVQHCIQKQKSEDYTSVKPDMECEAKAQLIAYTRLLKYLDSWIGRCRDNECKKTISSQRNRIQTRVNYLHRRQPTKKELPELPEY
jgi:hypothetical protein